MVTPVDFLNRPGKPMCEFLASSLWPLVLACLYAVTFARL